MRYEEPFEIRLLANFSFWDCMYKVGEVDKAMDLLLKIRLDPDLSLSDRVSVNLLIADMGTCGF
jgi:hypothetical protein